MLTVNLSPTFEPFGKGLHDISSPFPSGIEANFQLSLEAVQTIASSGEEEVMLTCRFEGHQDLFRLLIATDAVRRAGAKKVSIFIPFLPYARQDRVCRVGEGFSLKIFADMINVQKYHRVILFDPHSAISEVLIDRSETIHSDWLVRSVLEGKSNFLLVSPDAGAAKRVEAIAKSVGCFGHITQCLKYRTADGSVEEVRIFETDFGGKDLYIIDDICDGGATFIHLAKALRARNAGKVYLVVSHGIFSKGLSVLKEGGIDHIFTTNSIRGQTSNDFLTVLPLCQRN